MGDGGVLMKAPAVSNPADGAVPLPERGRRILVVFNPAAGRGRKRLSDILARLETLGCQVTLRETTGPGDAGRIVRQESLGYDVVAVAGGDGTINEAANGLADMAAAPALAIIPFGTANVLAWEIGLGTGAARTARTIAEGQPLEIYTGLINGRHFLMMAGVGFDAAVVASVDARLKRVFGKLAYVWRMAVEMFHYRYPMFTITVDGVRYEAASAVVAKGHFYGGQFICAPAARLTDPSFEVCLFLRGGRWHVARYAVALALGRLASLPTIRIVRGRDVTLDGPAGVPVQADGELAAQLPARIQVSAQRVRLLRPIGD
jgi:YegS/Rv2252/BmrU family lipid kinase